MQVFDSFPVSPAAAVDIDVAQQCAFRGLPLRLSDFGWLLPVGFDDDVGLEVPFDSVHVRSDQCTRAGFAEPLLHDVCEAEACDFVEPSGELIDDDEIRLLLDHQREIEAFALAVRQLLRQLAPREHIAEADAAEQLCVVLRLVIPLFDEWSREVLTVDAVDDFTDQR